MVLLKVFKRSFKLFAKIAPLHVLRTFFLKLCGYRIGRKVYIGEDIIIVDDLENEENLVIEEHVTLGPRVTLILTSYPNVSRMRNAVPELCGTITIKEDAWIGAGAIILPNTEIGKGAVIGAGSVVTKNVNDYAIVGGIPAEIIGKIDSSSSLHKVSSILQ
jgi:maltose O-acetyltransferase